MELNNLFLLGVLAFLVMAILLDLGRHFSSHLISGITLYEMNRQLYIPLLVIAKMKNRLSTLVCISSIGPGATNMITAAAGATINRLPVLLLPGDIFASRQVAPVLQQLESTTSQDFSVNDCFKPVSKYWDRINRPEQLITALPEVMRVLTSPADTGAVTLCIPQDVQAEAYEFPVELFGKRIWHIPRPRPDVNALMRAVDHDSFSLTTLDYCRRWSDLQRGRKSA